MKPTKDSGRVKLGAITAAIAATKDSGRVRIGAGFGGIPAPRR